MTPNEELEKKVVEVDQSTLQSLQNKKKRRRKMIFNVILVFVLTVIAIWITIGDSFDEIFEQLSKVFISDNWIYLLAVVGIMFLAVFIRSLVLLCFARLYTKKYHLHQAIAVDQIGVFYNAVTPGSSGGQVMQAYTYSKQGITISSAVSMLAMYSIMFQIVLIFYGLLSFIIKYDAITAIGSISMNIGFGDFEIPIWPLTIIGFLLNVSVIAIVLLMGYWRGFHNFVMGPCISLLHKIKIIKNADKTRESLRVQVENFKIEMRRIYSNIPFALLICLLFAVYITVKYSTPYFVGLALGNQSKCASFWDSVFLCNYHQMVTGMIPIPGSAGVTEIFFVRLFVHSNPTESNSFYYMAATDALSAQKASEALCNASLLIWRSTTFIIPLIIAGFVTAFYHSSPKEEVKTNGNLPSRETFISLQATTYETRRSDLDTMLETSRLTRQAVIKRLKTFGKNNYKKGDSNHKPHKQDKTHISKTEYDDIRIKSEDDSL